MCSTHKLLPTTFYIPQLRKPGIDDELAGGPVLHLASFEQAIQFARGQVDVLSFANWWDKTTGRQHKNLMQRL